MKIVRHIDGHLVMRPGRDHPNPNYWTALKDTRREAQRGSDGRIYCGCCWRTEDAHPFDLHHRHYDSFGNEALEDVILLCRSCHAAITSRIREERFALGDRSFGVAEEVVSAPVFRPVAVTVKVEVTEASNVEAPCFRPNFG